MEEGINTMSPFGGPTTMMIIIMTTAIVTTRMVARQYDDPERSPFLHGLSLTYFFACIFMRRVPTSIVL
jgi:hypothetical protein